LVIAISSVNLLILFIKFKLKNVPVQLKDRKTIQFWATLLINAYVPGGGDISTSTHIRPVSRALLREWLPKPLPAETYTSSLGKSSGPAWD
jgi:hypothetical protein